MSRPRTRQLADPERTARALSLHWAGESPNCGGYRPTWYELMLMVKDSAGCDFKTASDAVLEVIDWTDDNDWAPKRAWEPTVSLTPPAQLTLALEATEELR